MSCQLIVVVQVNETIMLLIVTDRNSDYIFVTDFDAFGAHLDEIINQACRTVQPSTPSPRTTRQPSPGESTLRYLNTFLVFTSARSVAVNGFFILYLFVLKTLTSHITIMAAMMDSKGRTLTSYLNKTRSPADAEGPRECAVS